MVAVSEVGGLALKVTPSTVSVELLPMIRRTEGRRSRQ